MTTRSDDDEDENRNVRDGNGALLTEGDTVTVITDLKVKGLVLQTCFLKDVTA